VGGDDDEIGLSLLLLLEDLLVGGARLDIEGDLDLSVADTSLYSI
jgi:hypothetical protein